jgi:bifunctional DNase/RNase
MIQMRIVGVRVEMTNQQPILLLEELSGPRSLPILIGQVEANAIVMHLEGMRPQRPLTHDLLGQVITALGRKVEQVRVVDFREGTYFGELAFDDGTTVSARPSDAIALAVRADIPVFVEDAVLEVAGVVVPTVDESEEDPDAVESDEEPENAEQEVERFREFLDSVSPEDFGSDKT